MNALRFVFEAASESMAAAYALGVAAGAGFELFKINFEVQGFSYYKSFRKNQLAKQLAQYEQSLIETDRAFAERVPNVSPPT